MSNQTVTSNLSLVLPGHDSHNTPWGAADLVLAQAINEIDAQIVAGVQSNAWCYANDTGAANAYAAAYTPAPTLAPGLRLYFKAATTQAARSLLTRSSRSSMTGRSRSSSASRRGFSMLVRMLTGRDRGELRDVALDAGRLLLADGRATYPCPDHPSQLASERHGDREGLPEVKARASRSAKRSAR
jgi:hypothetical protein